MTTKPGLWRTPNRQLSFQKKTHKKNNTIVQTTVKTKCESLTYSKKKDYISKKTILSSPHPGSSSKKTEKGGPL